MNRIILDANYIIGVLDERDVCHQRASLIEEKLAFRSFDGLVFLDCVINEVVSVLVRRLKERKRLHELSAYIRKLQALIPKNNITWAYPEIEDHYDDVIKTVEDASGALNFHDALIVHVANEFEIKYIVSFDKGFDKTGLKRIKDAGDI